MDDLFQKARDILESARSVVIIQADNPDGDSLASALALEEILGELGKDVHLYCAVSMPDYLKHLSGWDRVQTTIPTSFDASIIVDTSAITLLDKLESSPYKPWVASKPVVVLDHHQDVVCDIPYASVAINQASAVATGEVIYALASFAGWKLTLAAKTHIASSILADSLGLSSEGTTAQTYRIMADLIEAGVDRPALEDARRALGLMPESIFRYKAKLIERTDIVSDGRIGIVTIPQTELNEFSPLYNPKVLILNDVLQVTGIKVGIVLKRYHDGRTTGAIRCTHGTHIAAQLAEHFGGGGHPYASGFKVSDGRPLAEIKSECIRIATELLDKDNRTS